MPKTSSSSTRRAPKSAAAAKAAARKTSSGPARLPQGAADDLPARKLADTQALVQACRGTATSRASRA
jgi:hypothetical protein